jgi:thiol-disulfide isomerase/thioredoxin
MLLLFIACGDHPTDDQVNRIKIPATNWRFTLDLNGSILPFNGTFTKVGKRSATLVLKNHTEKIVIDDVILRNDSVYVKLPYFNSELQLRIESPYMMSGRWTKLDLENYSLPLNAEQGQDFRFTNTKSRIPVASKYAVTFVETDGTKFPAVLLLDNNQGKLSGTFLTETGDYRYLQGDIMNGQVNLSTFDGSHAFFFTASIDGDSLVDGIFKSGPTYQSAWFAIADSTASLRAPEDITSSAGDEPFDFSLIDSNNKTVSWNDLDLDGKVVVFELMGTWCPNCMDASKALSKLEEPYSDDDLVIFPVLFEYEDNLAFAKTAYQRYQKNIDNLPDDFLFGGKASKEVALEKFPTLSDVSSFPTIIFVDKNRKVREVYTGFYGPGTGRYYEDFMQSKSALISQLVLE